MITVRSIKQFRIFCTNSGLDHQVVAEAVEAVSGARSEAAQAMLSARTQVLHANAQFESQVAQLRNEIVAGDAALSLAIEKEKLLSTKLEESMKEAEVLRSNIIRLSQNGAGETEQAIVLRVAEIEKTLATMLMRLDQMGHPQSISPAAFNAAGSSCPSRLTRPESMIENLKTDQARDRDSVQLLYAEIVEVKQDKWWAEDRSPSNPEIRFQQGASPMNRPGTFEMFSDDEQEHHAASSSAGVRDLEFESLRTKDLHHFKVPPLPNDAGQFRSWKNSLRALIMSYDRSSRGMLLDWFNKALVARAPDECKELADFSGDFPRFDKIITAASCKPEHLRSHFGVRFQSFLEACESAGSQARGRFMLNMVAKEFDIDRNSGAITTALELYNLPPPQENIASLKQWRDNVRYIMNQISAADQPEPRLLAKWLYDRLRKHPSNLRTFEWL